MLSVSVFLQPDCSRKDSAIDDNVQTSVSGSIVLTLKDNNKKFKVKNGVGITVKLKGYPSTGYEWFLQKIEGNSIKETAKPGFRSYGTTPDTPDAAADYIFTLNAVKPGKAKLIFVNARPWNRTEDLKFYYVVITVE